MRFRNSLNLGSILLLVASPAMADDASVLKRGATVYRQECQRCHGAKGEGVAGKQDEPLTGERSIEALAKYIQRTMPEDDPGSCSATDSQAVAAFIHGAFYSPEARARMNPVRRELQRLTHRQYQESIADLLAGFGPIRNASKTGALNAEYFQSKGMNKKERSALKRQDARVDFDFGTNSPAEGITADQFSIAWSGSLLAPESGTYEFRVRTPNGARLYLNSELAAGDSNRRDDSDARRQSALIDLWVSSGGQMREETAAIPLLGGRSYPLRVDFFKFKETNASVRVEWRPPHGSWAPLPPQALSPEASTSWVVVGTPFPADDSSQGYERGTAISKEWLDAVSKGAVEVASVVEERLGTLTGSREGATNRVAALKAFSLKLAERAFRQPLTREQKSAILDRSYAAGIAPEIAVKRSVLRILTAPEFLYPDLANESGDAAVASRLALALWDSVPDEALRTAMEKGELKTEAQVREQGLRMLTDPRARAKLRGFFHHWLKLEEASDISKDPKAYPGFDEALVSDLRWSLETFLDHVVWGERSDYRELLQADYLFLNDRLARFYGGDVPAGGDFVPVRFDASQRAGVLTHPLLLAAFSYHRNSSPIHRGVFLTRNVLGRTLRPPPMAIEFMDDRFDPSLTMREKVTELTRKPNCMGCHSTINPLGFSLEHFDATGRYRTVDNAKPINAVSEYTTADGRVLRLAGARDVANHASESPDARRSFVRQLFQHTWKQSPAAYGPLVLGRLDQDFATNNQHIRRLWIEIAAVGALKSPPRKP
jgi:hypothetical protein